MLRQECGNRAREAGRVSILVKPWGWLAFAGDVAVLGGLVAWLALIRSGAVTPNGKQ